MNGLLRAFVCLFLLTASPPLAALPGPPGKTSSEELIHMRRAELAVREALLRATMTEGTPPERIAQLRMQLEEARTQTRLAGERGGVVAGGVEAGGVVETGLATRSSATGGTRRILLPLLVILSGVAFIVWLVRRSDSRQVVGAVSPASEASEVTVSRSDAERERRSALAFAGVGLVSAPLLFVGLVWFGSEIGLSLALSFAGTLVMFLIAVLLGRDLFRDVLKGVVLLLERSVEVHDVIRVGEVEGVVERITLRSTMVRDFDGGVHHVPNSEIYTLSNFTRAWSRASTDVRVAYEEDLDRVLGALHDAVDEVRGDPAVGEFVADSGTIIGVDRFEDGGAILRVSLKTRPLREVAVEESVEQRIGDRLAALRVAADLCPRVRKKGPHGKVA